MLIVRKVLIIRTVSTTVVQKTEIQRRFTTTIPKKIRDKLGLKEGMQLFWDVEGDKIVLYPGVYESLKGIFKGKVEYSTQVKAKVEESFLRGTRDG
jgi:AbrB family looped-hinge helix DNA binding protein